ncbi:MAG: hypothetical protein SGBAC_008591 [Bacillariaceae sp.]
MRYPVLLLAFLLMNTGSANTPSDLETSSVFQWLSGMPGFMFNPKLKMRGTEIYVDGNLDTSEVLIVIPSEAILDREEYDEVDDPLCTMLHILSYEIELGENSTYAPYISHILETHDDDANLPAMWSNIGQRLYETVGLKSFRLQRHMVWRMLPQQVTKWIRDYESCFEELDDEFEKEVENQQHADDRDSVEEEEEDELMLGTPSEAMLSHIRFLTLAAKHQVELFAYVPLYDQIKHHHVEQNVEHEVRDDDSIAIVATLPISQGATLYRPTQACLFDCEAQPQDTVIDTLRTFGEVQSYPHYWHFPFGVSFIFNGSGDAAMASSADTALPTLQWIKPLEQEWQFVLLHQEYGRQVDLYWEEVMPSREWVPEEEWEVIRDLSNSLIDALEFAVTDGEELLKLKEKERGETLDTKEGGGSEDTCSNHTVKEKTDTTEESKSEELSTLEALSQASGRDPWAIQGCKSDRCDLYELNAARDCKSHSYNTIHNETSWVHMRAAYIATVGPRQSTIKGVHGSGMQVAYKIGHSPGRGRGIYATESIAKGSIVWKAEYSAAFSTGIQFRRFLASLPDVLACDIINWCYTSKLPSFCRQYSMV